LSGAAGTRAVGDRWERAALAYLQRRGLTLVAANVQSRVGEIDLVMRDGDILCFIEVRYRSAAGFGGPEGSVDPNKCRRIAAAANHFLMRQPAFHDWPCRFDVISVRGGLLPKITWWTDAFRLDDLSRD